MPTITLSKKVLETLVQKKLPENELKDRISMLGTDLERIEGDEIVVEIFPDRPDMLSEQGFARAFASFIGTNTGLRKYDVIPSGEKVIIEKSVSTVRPYTACAIVKNLKLDDEKIREIIEVQEKLHVTFGRNRKRAAIGIYPLEHIKCPIRFTGKKPGEIKFKPLEFPRELTGKEILSKHPTGKEYAHLLEGKSIFPFFIDANNEVLSMPPVINSEKTGKVTGKTTEVFVECSGFDLAVLKQCLNIIVTTLADMGGKIFSMELEYPDKKIKTPNLEPGKVNLDIEYANQLLGFDLKEADIKKYLSRMGFGYEKGTVLVPAYRADIIHPVDIIEDIAIAYGFENVKPEIPAVATLASEDKFHKFTERIAQMLVGLGLTEICTYHISNEEVQSNKMNYKINCIKLANSLTSEYDLLRAWMIPNTLQVLSENKHNEYPQNLFEIGTVFKHDKNNETETGVKENIRVSVALCHGKSNFTGIKQVMDYIFNLLEVKYEIKEDKHSSFIEGRVGRVSVNGKGIAYLGEVHPKVLSNFEIEQPVSALELNLSELFELLEKK